MPLNKEIIVKPSEKEVNVFFLFQKLSLHKFQRITENLKSKKQVL